MYKRLNECYAKYEPNRWNNNMNFRQSHNCYAYFLNDQSQQLADIYKREDNKDRHIINPQPGHYCGMTKFVNYKETTCDNLIKRVICDNPNIQVVKANSSLDFDCDENYYKGALFANEGSSYHFLRQDENGLWSHKDGGGKATNLDDDGNLITDPKFMKTKYKTFCSYFCVPKNGYKKTNFARNRYRDNQFWYKN